MAQPGLTLYYAPQTRAVRALWALEELGVTYDKVRLDLGQGDQKRPAFLAVNPNGKVPALVVDGTPMFESVAILLYLAERFGVAKGLWPRADDPARCEALSWLAWEHVTVTTDITRLIELTGARVPAEWHNAAHASAARADLERDFGLLEARLAQREYVVGNAFTLVDLSLAFAATFCARAGLVDLARWPRLSAWHGKAAARPALTRALEA